MSGELHRRALHAAAAAAFNHGGGGLFTFEDLPRATRARLATVQRRALLAYTQTLWEGAAELPLPLEHLRLRAELDGLRTEYDEVRGIPV